MNDSVRLEGNFFSRDFLTQLASGELAHTLPASYGLPHNGKVRERIAQSWNALSGRWTRFRAELAKLPGSDAATGLTRREWLLPLLEELGFGRVQLAPPLHALERDYAISHGWNGTPVHLLGARVALDKKSPGVAGAAQAAPHAFVQELLNRSPDHSWAIVSNGGKLRVLRDSANIARQSFVEFDLQAIFDDGDAPAFALLWLLCHASRFENRARVLEEWLQTSKSEGERALEQLRRNVEAAIKTLATGFLEQPQNGALRERLRGGEMSALDYYRQALRVVYRMLFVLVAESKDALLMPDAEPAARERYEKYFSLTRLKTLSAKKRGDAHFDVWRGLRISFAALREGEAGLAVPALGGFLFEPLPFDACELSNRALLSALRELGFFEVNGGRRSVNFHLGSEELGSVYESLLELSPRVDLDARRFELQTLAGNERKTTGSYYTPEILVKSLLESALEPLIEAALREVDPEAALLKLTILDPACGSGHFLTAAARRVANALALVRCGGDEPPRRERDRAMRDVVGACVYGVDLNPMAVELCKVALWMEALEPGRPLSFLDAHIREGNALLGATPDLLHELPDAAFAPLEGDDRAVVNELKRRNKAERAGQTALSFDEDALPLGDLGAALRKIEDAPELHIEQVRQKERDFAGWLASASYRYTHLLADAWCAAFVWRRVKDADANFIEPITHDDFLHIRRHARARLPQQETEIARLANLYKWFHPHLEFPLVSADGGFACVLGNPPWERVKLQEKEWFATRAPEIANAPNASRRKALIDALFSENFDLHRDFLDARRRAEGESHFARSSGRYPLCGVGDVNTYALFAELDRDLIGPRGRVGVILPTGIATDDTTKAFFGAICDARQLASLFDFENREKLFRDVDSRFKFCALTLTGREAATPSASFLFFAHNDADLSNAEKRFALSPDEIALLNPNTKTCPIFRSRHDAELTKAIYRRVPVLVNEAQGKSGNPWNISFLRMLDMSNDSGLFQTRDELAPTCALHGNVWQKRDDSGQASDAAELALPLYEAKMLHHYDHRWATYADNETRDVTPEEKANPDFVVQPRYWVNALAVQAKLRDKWDKEWLLGFRDITNTTNERTMIACILPRVAVGHKAPLLIPDCEPKLIACLLANLSSLAFDYITRQKMGGTSMTYFIVKQLPVLPPATYAATAPWSGGLPLRDWIASRVVELSYTAHDLTAFARDCGFDGEPFGWNAERRLLVKCELDAAMFRLYGLSRDEAAHVLDSFPIVRRKDEATHGSYRTKTRILELLDAM